MSSLDEFREDEGVEVDAPPAGDADDVAAADCGGLREHMGAAHTGAKFRRRRREAGNMCNMLGRMRLVDEREGKA